MITVTLLQGDVRDPAVGGHEKAAELKLQTSQLAHAMTPNIWLKLATGTGRNSCLDSFL